MQRFGLALAGLLLTLSPLAVAAELSEEQQAKLQERMAETRARLELTDEQVEQMQPVMQSATEAQQAILQRYGIDLDDPSSNKRLGFRDARKLKSDMSKVRSDTVKQLEQILSDEQLKEFKKIQEERRQEIKQRIQAGR